MVETVPSAVPSVGSLGAVGTLGPLGNLREAVVEERLEGGVARIIIEVARHKDACVWAGAPHRVDRLGQSRRHPLPIRASGTFAARPAGCVHHENMERVAAYHLARDIKDVSGGAKAFGRNEAYGMVVDEAKGKGRPQQGHVMPRSSGLSVMTYS